MWVIMGLRSRIGAEERLGDLGGGLGAHIEDFSFGGQWETGLLEQSFHSTRITGGDSQFATRCDRLQTRIAVRGHFTEIRDGLEACFRSA